MALHFYDTRRRRKVPFEPITSGEVKLYTCGPTVYNDAHIGNFRTYMFEDLLRRTLKYLGFKVTQVMNLTDVDDKTIRGARTNGVSLNEYTAPYIQRFFADLDALKIERAEVYPAATDHIPEMITLIEQLIAKGIAYVAEGNVYYSVEKYGDYGQLSGMNLESLARGVRIDADEYEDKENFRDFALWKAWSEEDGDVWWDSPWGRGRPGWHIECSAMSMKYLGESFDIHTGGVDNIFPHHENEIAQSCAATGHEFSRYWLHSAHLQVEGEKMSKSLGNFYTLRDLREQNKRKKYSYPEEAFRFVLLTTHYRKELNYTSDALLAAKLSVWRLQEPYIFATQAIESSRKVGAIRLKISELIEKTESIFRAGLEDDLNIAVAIAALFGFVTQLKRLKKENELTASEGKAVLELWKKLDTVLGFLTPWTTSQRVQSIVCSTDRQLVHLRDRLKEARLFRASDFVRSKLIAKGLQLSDTKYGVTLRNGFGQEQHIKLESVRRIPKKRAVASAKLNPSAKPVRRSCPPTLRLPVQLYLEFMFQGEENAASVVRDYLQQLGYQIKSPRDDEFILIDPNMNYFIVRN